MVVACHKNVAPNRNVGKRHTVCEEKKTLEHDIQKEKQIVYETICNAYIYSSNEYICDIIPQ